MKKPTYEELEHRFQSYCKHDVGRTSSGNTYTICSACGWDVAKCQHRKADSWDAFCRECGEPLKQRDGAA